MLVLLMIAVTGVWADDEAVTYALKTTDSFTSGQTVEVKNAANDVVATITVSVSMSIAKKATKYIIDNQYDLLEERMAVFEANNP